MFFDYHLHSHFSADSGMKMDDLCQAAILKGLDEIAITDHHDIDYQDNKIEFLIDKDKYLKEIEKMQKRYEGELVIKKGIEMGIQSHILQECDNYLANNFDFVIGSFHTVEKSDLYNGDFFEGYSQWEAYIKYLKAVLKVVKEYDNYNVIGHLDIIRRYGNFEKQPDLMENNEAAGLIKEILRMIIKKERGLEVNTSGYRIDGKNPLPSFDILKLYYKQGGKILTIGSDSHKTATIAQKFDFTVSKLKKIGFKYLTTFKNMKPKFHKI
ncbi:histidinol-phosphatase (PHP family) [Halanaerobium congolense]|jgi:histidinol-phosphatase (PHP family)|uniref:Histidinol-phosphatase n=1 Tax=Halanaerobium congolense TaxID=54121 RepID=A0A1M7N1L8_9FIRM|nr:MULTISPECIES: histidinol-phosphatase HisJ family protein [Halanaerobium]KXS49399.1 MAG: histidinol-phosphatase (PHP family) [Halanaerobium sp. T82-1]OEG63726.1 MAG: histidinol phosphate phosphatase [Halanaerobium sp. MDAL1]PTX16097.1 histidinol-phosphatase (PHP family) [Halanaerobium congolense]PUU95107.1 MAG: Histidinol-phosphatase [Halanaerobium sp.]TDX35094.1 histidinol-phosphatase (PHP family) [Halanaerobium congolense]